MHFCIATNALIPFNIIMVVGRYFLDGAKCTWPKMVENVMNVITNDTNITMISRNDRLLRKKRKSNNFLSN